MAFDFFALCPSYQSASRMTKDTRLRRELIIAQLPDDYSARTKKTQTKVKWTLDDAGIKASIHTVRADLSLIRSTYQFLSGNESRRAVLLDQAGKNFPNASVIRFFQKDGLDTWEKLMQVRAGKSVPVVSPAPVIAVAPVEPVDAIQVFLRASQALADELRTAKADVQNVVSENLSLRARLESLETRVGGIDVTQVERFLELARDLQRGRLAAGNQPVVQASALPPASVFPEGPQASSYFGKAVVYSEQFGRNAKQVDPNTRRELLRVLGLLATEGPREPTIKCASRPGSTGLMNLKLFRMFVIWQDTASSLTFHWIESSGQPICK